MTLERKITWAILAIGTLTYYVVAFGAIRDVPTEYAGEFIYNYYWLAILDGRTDIPMRIVGLEGHYDTAGRAFVYNGLAPLLVRAAMHPFVDLTVVSAAPMTVFLFTAAGTAVYHLAFSRVVAMADLDPAAKAYFAVLIGMMVWVTSAGSVLISNTSVYHEPIAVAYFCSAVAVALMARVILDEWSPLSVLIPLALAAALCVHARPHLAVGLYAGIVLLILVHFRRSGAAGLGRTALALAIMGASGLLVIGWNLYRFDDPAMMHGSFGKSALEYGFTYWGLEPIDSPRALTFQTEGRFYPLRIPGTMFLYLFDSAFLYPLDQGVVSMWGHGVFKGLTSGLGFIRIELPWVGIVFLWTPWIVLIALAYLTRQCEIGRGWILLIATGIGMLMLASYATVTLRYRVDLWPFVAALALMSLPRMLDVRRGGALTVGRIPSRMAMTFLFGALFSLAIAVYNNHILTNTWPLSTVPEEDCLRLAEDKGFSPDDIARICAL